MARLLPAMNNRAWSAMPTLRALSDPWLSRIPPKWHRYRFISAEDLVAYAGRVPECELRYLAPEHQGPIGLPENVLSLGQLPDSRGRWARSFRDVPGRHRVAPALVTIPHGTIVTAEDRWGLEHFAVVGQGPRRLVASGLRWTKGHQHRMIAGAPERHFAQVVWPWESWYLNYFHWMVRHVPKLAWIKEQGLLDYLLLPPRFELTDLHRASAKLVGVDLDDVPRAPGDLLTTDMLTVVVAPDLHPLTVDAFRGPHRVDRADRGGRRLYVRRVTKGRRQIGNEAEVLGVIRSFGFEEVVFDEMSFDAQREVCGQADVILGLHGAGLTNIIFAPKGTSVVEIVDPSFPNPEYYELAAIAEQRYWMICGEPVPGSQDWGYGDVRLSPDVLRSVLNLVVGE